MTLWNGLWRRAFVFTVCAVCAVFTVLVVDGAPLSAQLVAADPSKALKVLERPVSVDLERVSVREAITALAQRTGIRISFREAEITRLGKSVSLSIEKMPLGTALSRVLSGTQLRVVPVSEGLIVLTDMGVAGASVAQGGITGKVIDTKSRKGLRGATITLSGINRGAISGDDGSFRLADVPPGSYTMQVRMLGYVKATRTTVVSEGQMTSIEVALEPSVNALDQIVVTGTVVSTELKAVPNAMTVITAKDIEQRGITRIDQLFRGDVPGLFVRNVGADNALDQVTMFSRGATMLQGSTGAATNPIKTYVDGVEIADASYLSQIDPHSIDRIEILTGPQASTIYGSNAINGVMQIFTKRGTMVRPRLMMNLLSGFVENSFRSALTPQHDYSATVDGTEGHISYNVGGSWNYMGRWSPGKQTARTSGFGGLRWRHDIVTTDASIRLGYTINTRRGATSQWDTDRSETGINEPSYGAMISPNWDRTLRGQTLGLTVGVTPKPWWSHELIVGSDVNTTGSIYVQRTYRTAADTVLFFETVKKDRLSTRYATTLQARIASYANAVLTLGADQWRTGTFSVRVSPAATTGTLSGTPTVVRTPDHDVGGFVQAQLGITDALFLTYGLRAEWNPNYGDDAQPNLAPRYGLAYTRDLTTPLGSLTAKLRTSFGRSTRPPLSTQKLATPATALYKLTWFGPYDEVFANPELGPESQQGGEGGIELYFGSRASLIVTRYNQTVNNLIALISRIDSVRSLMQYPPYTDGVACTPVVGGDGYCYGLQSMNLNVGSIRNQGWELQGSVNTGPFTTRGTYSWTKSRVLGITPKYRAMLTGSQYQPGSSFKFLPEHTWAINMTYANTATMLNLVLNGTGFLYRERDDLYSVVVGGNGTTRLASSKPRMAMPSGYKSTGPAYVMADLNASRRISPMIEGILQVQNLTDYYRNDYGTFIATIGRQSRAGLRIRF